MIAIEKISLAQYQKDRLDTAPGDADDIAAA